jgi:hypothetical protein
MILSLWVAGAAQAQVVGYWNFEEKLPGNAAGTVTNAIADISGNSHLGTVSDPGIFYVAGNTNYGGTSALEFAVEPNHVAVPDPTGAFNFSSAQSVTVEAMIKTVTIGQDGVGALVCKQGASPGEWWWRINATGTQQFFVDDGTGARNVSGTKKLNDGRWHHVAAVFDAGAQRLRVYVDYLQDGPTVTTTYSSGAPIGNAKDLWIGAFQTGNREFVGDIDFVRISASALAPADFVQPLTYITGMVPQTGSGFVSVTNTAGFEVKSPAVGVLTNNIHVAINGIDVSSQMSFSGNANDWLVSLPALIANRVYRVQISVADQQGHPALATNVFNTFTDNLFSFEAEDYNFGGGQFIDNPQLSGTDGPNNYLDRLGVQDIDFGKTNPPVSTIYRIGDAVGTVVSGDVPRQQFIDAQASDPAVADYIIKDFVNGEWVNYTRTFPGNSYHLYARISKNGTVPMVLHLDEVTSDSTAAGQTITPIGSFISPPTGSAQSYASVPLTDGLGHEISLPLSGVKTLRVTMASGTTGMLLNYFIFVPEGGVQVPFLAAVSPAPGADNEPTNTAVHITVRNADTQINTGTVQLKLDGSAVAATVIPSATGAQVNYTPATLAVGLHTLTLIFNDSTATGITNTWQFRVASPAVRGQWNFNEQAAGALVSTAPGALLDVSGNSRNGTANDPSMQYVTGGFNYGNTPALRFTPGFDRVVVPDTSGSFNYSGSFTWEAVIRSSATATNLAILAKNGTGDGEGEYWWRVPGPSGGVQSVGMNDGTGAKFIGGTTALNDGNWHHVAVVYDTNAQQIRLYADYTLEGTLTNVFFTNSIGRPADLQIGGFTGGGSEFDGDIDAIRLSNGALTTGQFIQRTVALAPIVKSMRPGTNAVHVFPTPLIQLDLLNRDTRVVQSSLKMYLDGADVSAGATTSTNATGASILYQPVSALADGLHTVLVTFNDTASPANSITNQWSFTVVNSEPIVGFYQLNEKSAGNLADTTAGAILDSSPGHLNGMVTGLGLPYVSGSPSYGNTPALGFVVSSSNHISVPDPAGVFNFTPVQSITLEAIIRTTNIGQASVGSLVAKQLAATPEWWWRINATGFQQFNINDGSAAKSVSGTKKLNDGQWHHVAVLYDGAAKQLRAYVDYVQDGVTVKTTYTSTTSTIGSAEDLWIGAFQAGNRLFDGDIDVVRITRAPLDVSWFIPLGGIANRISLSNVVTGPTSISFSFATETGRSYEVQASDALGSAWTMVETITGDGSTKTVTYQRNAAQRFYRVKVL